VESFRYFLDISYKGTQFHGWQVQPNAITIQQHLEECLALILRKKTALTASGRTDAGVHALSQIAHFDSNIKLDLSTMQYKLNNFIHPDISINAIYRVQPTSHARFDAISRTYHYFIDIKKNPFNNGLTWYFKKPLTISLMNRAAEKLLHYTDFTSFSKLHTDTPHNLCAINSAYWETTEYGYKFSITANRFLRGMVRAIVGSLVEVGLEKITVEDFEALILKQDRLALPGNAPADGLFLAHICYPENIIYTEEE